MSEGVQLHLFDVDKYLDEEPTNIVLLRGELKTHTEFNAPGFCVVEIGGYGKLRTRKWMVIEFNEDNTSKENSVYDNIHEALAYIERLTNKPVRFRLNEIGMEVDKKFDLD